MNIINYDLIIGLFLFFLTMISGVAEELLGCKNQKFLIESRLIKHVICYLGIVFFIALTLEEEHPSPLDIFKKGFVIYIAFILASKTKFPFGLLFYFLLLVIYIIQMQKKHIKHNRELGEKGEEGEEKIAKDKEGQKESELTSVQHSLFIVACVVLVSSFVYYLIEKYREYGRDFSVVTFLVGTSKCKSLA